MKINCDETFRWTSDRERQIWQVVVLIALREINFSTNPPQKKEKKKWHWKKDMFHNFLSLTIKVSFPLGDISISSFIYLAFFFLFFFSSFTRESERETRPDFFLSRRNISRLLYFTVILTVCSTVHYSSVFSCLTRLTNSAWLCVSFFPPTCDFVIANRVSASTNQQSQTQQTWMFTVVRRFFLAK